MHKKEKGFTLVELLVVIVIIGILATIVISQVGTTADEAKVVATKAKIEQIADAIQRFKLYNDCYPERLEDLVDRPSYAKKWPTGGFIKRYGDLKDAWGNDFIYNPNPQYDVQFEIISYGADGREGGEGFDEDIRNHDKWKKR
jgi:general secretion pathway protein G